MKKTILISLLLSILIASAAVTYRLYSPFITEPAGIVFDVPVAMSKSSFAAKLSQYQPKQGSWIFALYVYFHPSERVKTGEYFFPKGASFVDVFHQIVNGKGLYYRPFTIIPGWTFNQIKQTLSQSVGVKQTLSNLTNDQIMQLVSQTAQSPEGQFLPETYFYTKGNSDLYILKKAYELMQQRFATAWAGRDKNLPYQNAYDALIVASLVEKEAYLSAERPIIAGVIINRLRKNMILQIDPTVIYGMGDRYTGKITKQDLREDTPYNTYVHKGLPPTPIAMPSLATIIATLHPAQHNYLYFVARGDGSHQFSSSLSEHNAAVKKAIKQKQAYFNQEKIQQYLINVPKIGLL